ncbi:MAG TPA: 23S rRNA (uracil(1939)-C(5))-methyltransferase RlmD [Polyangia bacterium]|nr:23S rRNA (uracil(1939)-C(5))-methyltransferase RlmD [Polyangia bacterium]
MRSGDHVALTCDDLDDDGAGVGESGGHRVHVAGALPGERVSGVVAHVSRQSSAAWARLETVDAPSPARRPPACPAFGACGGCLLQHLAYDAQLEWKRTRVARALAEHPALAGVKVDACVASPRPLGYRNRSKLVVARREEGRPDDGLVLGAFAPRSHDVIDLAGCRIAEPPLDETAAVLRSLLDGAGVRAYHERTLTGDLRHVVLRANHEGRVLAVWIVARPLPDGVALARRFRAARPEVIGVVEHENRSRGNAIFSDAEGDNERLLDGAGEIEDQIDVAGRTVRLTLAPGAFFQANREVAALAYAAISQALAIQPTERVVDAYCGVGGIALTLAPAAAEVIGIESHAGAVAGATASAALNGIANARFVAGDAAQVLSQIERADVLVLNPPRKGCAPELLAEVARLAPRAIAYLSCDPETLARDLALLATHGHRARAVTPFDMLPHTPHIEALAVLALS